MSSMKYFEEKEDIKYIEKSKIRIEQRLLLLEKKVDIIINKLNDKK